MQQTFLNNVDTNKVDDLLNETKSNVEYFERISSEIVNSYASDLDNLMLEINKNVIHAKQAPLETIEWYFMKLTNTIYFMGERLEVLGIHDDMSKAAYKEVFNKAYLANQIKDTDKKNKTTVAELNALSDQASVYESVVNSIYSRVYKILKYKIDTAMDMSSCLRKVISSRMQEANLSAFQPKNGGQILNEDNRGQRYGRYD